jgi:probable DNA repair protein
VSGLESNAERYARLLREGLVPGWQFSKEHENALNVSYGRVLADFPAIYVALQLLRWVSGELRGADISGLLRSTHLGNEQPFGRSRAELRLRDIPDRNWSMARFLAAFRKNSCGEDFDDWLQALARLDERVAALPARTDPASWASHVVSLLAEMNWPGGGERNSADYQLENRWRELLNEFSTLGLVEKTMTLKVAVARIVALAAEAVFQPESEGAAVAVLGPLEAAGMEFDSLWVAGLGADDWPPPGRPTPLLSRDLQLANDMPDSSPQNTLEYARRVVARLQASASHCRISYAASVADREQLPSPLLQQLEADAAAPDPGWFADSLRAAGELKTLADDVPELREDELVSGGAATINRQYSEPFAAFAFGRLGVRWMQSFTSGIAPNVRGSIIHNALQHLYEQTPRAEEIAAWSANDVQGRVDAAINKAFYRSEKNADEVLLQLFRLERKRTAGLLAGVIAIDQQRSGFAIKSVENGIEGLIGPVRLSLRGDRIDVLDDASILILDYKTGTPKPFLTSGSPNDLQLVVYACSSDAEVGGLGLFNVDTREVAIDGAGPALRDDADWEASLSEWKDTVYQLAAELARGDVRINALQGGRDARPLHLLSRIAELTRAL